MQDLLAAARVYELAVQKGMGKDLGEMFPGSGGWYGDYPGSGYFRPS